MWTVRIREADIGTSKFVTMENVDLVMAQLVRFLSYFAPSLYSSVGIDEHLWTVGLLVRSTPWAIFFTWIYDSHCHRILPSLLIVQCLMMVVWESIQ